MLRSSNIQNSQLDFNDNVYVDSSIVPDRIRTRSNDVLMCVRNGSKSLVGKTALISDEHSDLAWGAFMTVLRPNTNNTLLYHYLNSPSFRKQVFPDLETATVKQITMSTLNRIKLLVPNTDEQDKISDFLSALDKRIEKQRQLVEALKSYKRGVLSAIFDECSILHMTDINRWKCYKIGDFLSPRIVKQVPSLDAPLMAFTAEGGVCQKGERYDRSFLVKDENKQYKRTEYNDFIYSSNNLDVGSIGLNKFGTAVISDVYEVFTIHNAVPTFISEAIQRKRTLQNILRFRQGVIYGQYRIYADDFLSVEISLPDYETQQKYASLIATIDARILKESSSQRCLEIFKNGLLQQLFI